MVSYNGMPTMVVNPSVAAFGAVWEPFPFDKTRIADINLFQFERKRILGVL